MCQLNMQPPRLLLPDPHATAGVETRSGALSLGLRVLPTSATHRQICNPGGPWFVPGTERPGPRARTDGRSSGRGTSMYPAQRSPTCGTPSGEGATAGKLPWGHCTSTSSNQAPCWKSETRRAKDLRDYCIDLLNPRRRGPCPLLARPHRALGNQQVRAWSVL